MLLLTVFKCFSVFLSVLACRSDKKKMKNTKILKKIGKMFEKTKKSRFRVIFACLFVS